MIIDVGNKKKRTHRITVISLLNDKDTKSFSAYCPESVDENNLISVCKKVMSDPYNYFDNYIEFLRTDFERKKSSHTVLVFNLQTKSSKTIDVAYPQYASHQLADYLAKQMGCEIKPYKKIHIRRFIEINEANNHEAL